MPNRLASAASPYLRQHADNPVDWYPWGEEALATAQDQQKPILLSVGYAACHWCHVMAHESFEDPNTAALMNELFINIKVDREERPDIDDIYMSAVQAMTGQGGWPMTVFLTPDTKPFFAGTYFPPEDRGGMPSFQKVMTSVAQAWSERPADVADQADRLAAAASRDIPPSDASPERDVLIAAYGALAATADRVHGGFGGAPKFPQAPSLEFLLRVMHEPWAPQAREIITRALGAMARGGIYDHLGGGFARYSVDSVWLVPHFEKMLYDNALLARLYGRASQETGTEALLAVAHETLEYLLADLALPDGGFASAADADSEGAEGKFYVFDYDEFMQLAGADAPLAAAVLGVTQEGNFEGSNILHAARSVEEVAAQHDLDPDVVAAAVGRAKAALRAARAERVRPALDDKVVTAWNGLAVRSLAEIGRISGRPDFVDAARRNARFVLAELRRGDGRLLRSWREGVVSGPAFLEDYGAYALGLYTLYMATGENEWYRAARRLVDDALDLFWSDGSFYATGHDAERLITRPRDLMDNPSPSGGSLLAEALLMTAHFTGEGRYFDRLDESLQAGGRLMEHYPAAVAHLLAVLHSSLAPPLEVAIVGYQGAAPLADVIWERFRPHVLVAPARRADGEIPLLEGRSAGPDDTALAYVCRRFACNAPVAAPEELRGQL